MTKIGVVFKPRFIERALCLETAFPKARLFKYRLSKAGAFEKGGSLKTGPRQKMRPIENAAFQKTRKGKMGIL